MKQSYDGLHRLKDATYKEGASVNNHYTEKVTGYDRNGNITTLQRYGRTGTSSWGVVDNLTLTRTGNQLTSVSDGGSAVYGGDFNAAAGTSTYNANGALTSDTGCKISSITWNEIDLPQTVTFSTGSTINYYYAVDGTKLREVRTISGTTNTIDWCGDLVLETDDYYPLGGPLPTGTSTALQPEKYQGKEWNPAASFNVYDFGARLYDPALGRWISQDPLMEKHYPQSPYLFCAGNPMRFVDPEGQEWREKNNIISVSLNLMVEGFDDGFLDTYKKTVSTMFDEIIQSASGGSYRGEVVFHTNDPNIVQSLSFSTSMDKSIGGTTSWVYSTINLLDNSGQLQSFYELAKTTIHELFHTVRLDHPFENTQTRDTQLIKTGPNSYKTTAFTDPNIVNNIMNYSLITIDGKYGDDMRYITKGQFEFIRKEIYLQYLGYGYNKEFNDYWESFPGLHVGN